jgi:hypothetical protein
MEEAPNVTARVSAKRLREYKARYVAMMGLKAYVPLMPCPEGICAAAWRDMLRMAVEGLECDARMEQSWFAPIPARQRSRWSGCQKQEEVTISDKRKVAKWVEYHKNLFAAATAFHDIAVMEVAETFGAVADVWGILAAYAEAYAENCAAFWGDALHTGSYSYWRAVRGKGSYVAKVHNG